MFRVINCPSLQRRATSHLRYSSLHYNAASSAQLPRSVSKYGEPYSLPLNSVAYLGSLIQYPEKAVLLEIDTFSVEQNGQTVFEFRNEDILKVEALPFRASVTGGEAVPMSKIWVKRGSTAKKWTSFVVE